MAKSKIVYDNWLAENGIPVLSLDDLGVDRYLSSVSDREYAERYAGTGGADDELLHELKEEVRRAITKLSDEERELVERVYFMGESISDLATKLRRKRSSLEALHRRCQQKLNKHLASFVSARWGMPTAAPPSCGICRSSLRKEIDAIIAARDKTKSWKPVLAILRNKFGMRAITAQLLKGHELYH